MIDVEVPASIRNRRAGPRLASKRALEIAEQTIELFNRYGASRLSVSRVAEQLNISAGNLHYHFRTNSDLFLKLFDMLDRDVRAVMLRPQLPMTFTDLIIHQIDVQRCLWHHRYFFRDLDFIIHLDEDLFVNFLDLQQWSIDQIVRHQELYRLHFGLRPLVPPQTETDIARNCWMMWTSWVRWEAIAGGEKPLPAKTLDQVLHRLTWYHFSHHLPFIEPKTALVVKDKLAELLGPLESVRSNRQRAQSEIFFGE